MRTLIYKTLPSYDGMDNTVEVEMPDWISWEVRYNCQVCGNELLESEIKEHTCKEEDL